MALASATRYAAGRRRASVSFLAARLVRPVTSSNSSTMFVEFILPSANEMFSRNIHIGEQGIVLEYKTDPSLLWFQMAFVRCIVPNGIVYFNITRYRVS